MVEEPDEEGQEEREGMGGVALVDALSEEECEGE